MPSKFRYFLSVLGVTKEVNPLGMGSATFKIERESPQIFYRTKLTTSVTFVDNIRDGYEDFEFLFRLENSTDRCEIVTFLVERYIDGQYKEFWKGKFSVTEAKWNLDKCTCEISIQVDDAYTVLLEEYEREHNVLSITDIYTVKAAYDFERVFEFGISDYAKNPEPLPATYGRFLVHRYKDANAIGITRRFERSIYFREAQTLPKENTEGPAGSGWEVIEELETTTRWARPPQLEGFTTYEFNDMFEPGKYPELLFVNCGNPVPSGYLKASDCDEWFTVGNIEWYWQFGSFYYKRNRRLLDVLYYLVGLANPELLPENKNDLSQFLTTSENYVTKQENAWIDAMLSQKSDIKRPNSTEPASKGLLSLKALTDDLRAMNLYWFVNSAGKFQVEHLSYFQLNLSIDTRPYPQNANKRIYEYLRSKMPRFERLRFSEEASEEFTEAEIEYEGNCVNKKEGENIVTYTISKLMTDVEGIAIASGEYADTGFVLLSVQPSTTVGLYELREQFSDTQNRIIPNYHFSALELTRNYLLHGRVLRSGLLSTGATLAGGEQLIEFLSVIKTKKQVSLSITDCGYSPVNPIENGGEYNEDYAPDYASAATSAGDFSPLAKFITDLSPDGELLTAQFSLKDEYLRLETLHEAIAGIEPFASPAEYGKDYSPDYSS